METEPTTEPPQQKKSPEPMLLGDLLLFGMNVLTHAPAFLIGLVLAVIGGAVLAVPFVLAPLVQFALLVALHRARKLIAYRVVGGLLTLLNLALWIWLLTDSGLLDAILFGIANP